MQLFGFWVQSKNSPTEIHKVVVEVYGENEISYLVRKPRRQTPPEKRGVNGKLMLKWIFEKSGVNIRGLYLIRSVRGPVSGFCELRWRTMVLLTSWCYSLFQNTARGVTTLLPIVTSCCRMTRQCAPRTRSRATRVCPGALASARLRAVFSPSVASALPENYSGRGRIHRGTAVTYMSACSPKVTPTLDRIARPSPLSNYLDITNYQLQFVLLWEGHTSRSGLNFRLTVPVLGCYLMITTFCSCHVVPLKW